MSASTAHTRVRCKKEKGYKVKNFLDGLDKTLLAEKSFDEICKLFTEHFIKSADVFKMLYHMTQTKNADKLDKIEDKTIELDDLREKETVLLKQLCDLRNRKRKAQEELISVAKSILN